MTRRTRALTSSAVFPVSLPSRPGARSMPVLHVRRVARGAAVGLGAAALAFSAAIMPLGAAAAEPGQTVTLLGFNDFHGALDSADDFACTITTARTGADRSVLISSGDNVGGSAFVSAVANAEPRSE